MIIKQLSIFLENKSGRLTEVSEILGRNDINMSAFSIADTADYGVLRVIVDKPELAVNALRENGFSVNLTDVICLIVPNQPGGLAKALRILSDNAVAIEYMYAFAMAQEASVVVRTETPEKAIDVLQNHKMELIHSSQIYKI